MANRRSVYGGGGGGGDALDPSWKFKNSSHDQPLDSVLASASSIPLLGSRAMLSFGGAGGVNSPGKASLFRPFDQDDTVDDYLDEYFNQPEKKRLLSVDQIQFLERNFAAENKLEPERKIQIAKELGLQPRQIAVWFQNRRARWKSRQLETDYEALHASYKNMKADYDNLLAENEKLKAEVLRLKRDGLPRDVEVEKICGKDPSRAMLEYFPNDAISEEGESRAASAMAFKNEEQSSGRSGVSKAEFLHSTITVEFEESDLSQNGEEELNAELRQIDVYDLPAPAPRIMEDAHCHTPASSFYYGFPADDHSFNFWSY
ncbi:homeobox-leucine zipper protein HAT5-like [Andrographis paniculata]|uniref:homeobox-leucine zipper protein HAT5-like n=1 Tax=Andrographis paniculata TaxID=175694 RepID=UPI0021E7F632|nr:homeobox-leucine zipper protein HAT5-like [Andrographis paniculata]